ncbi:MAG: hypothetical protein ABFC57_06300 [Veillonellales bacterium]
MPKRSYGPSVKFSKGTLNVIEQANFIIEDYSAQGFDLTLRQLYYQFVARDLLPNKQSEYKRLGSILNDARLAGLIDWGAIVDRTRFLRKPSFWDSPEDVIRSAAWSFKTDKWRSQSARIEAWIEKDALVGVIEPVCNRYEVPFFSCRGYVSQSEMWSAAQRIYQAFEEYEQPTIIVHLGDHDPSGIDMTRDIADRLKLFIGADNDWPDDVISVNRVALNMEQILRYNPPPNPAKVTDSRFDSYFNAHGGESWELDALDPKTLSGVIEDTILRYMDLDLWNKDKACEQETKKVINVIAANYAEVKDLFL